uniref:interleukin-17C-like n=1 Tax=Pristiophorus japonicus TaxID=55135 RepID=UPI00398F19E2
MGTGLQLLFIVLLILELGHTRRMKHDGTHHCEYPENLDVPGKLWHKLLGRANMDHFPSVALVTELEQQKHHREKDCPDLGFHPSSNSDINHRSISPWEYRIDYDDNRYPQKLAFAHCLCEGCIDMDNGEEIRSFNSVPVEQTMLVLQRQPCPGRPGQYSFNLKYIKVPVGCTCVRPKTNW